LLSNKIFKLLPGGDLPQAQDTQPDKILPTQKKAKKKFFKSLFFLTHEVKDLPS
jgi:hypothetical protein